MTKARIEAKTYLTALLGSLPLWIGSLFWSRKIYESLPDAAPSCFVVTAATRGHRRVVGPFFEIARRGGGRMANRQLLTFWQFEDAWRRHASRSHACFRRIYNRVGPVVARRITRAWMADSIFIALKPLEFVAAFFVRLEWSIFKFGHAREAGGSAIIENKQSGGGL